MKFKTTTNQNLLSPILLKLGFQLFFLFAIAFQSSSLFAQSQRSNETKATIRQNSNIAPKSSSKKTNYDLSSLNPFSSINRSNVCSPETSLIITEDSSWGISRSTINNSGVPSFCLSLNDESPEEDDIFNTTLTPLTDISFNNNDLD